MAKKLGIVAGCRLLLVAAPDELATWLAPMPVDVRFERRPSQATDIAHVFVTRRNALQKHLTALRVKLRSDTTVWVSWPKKAANVPTDITEDTIRAVALPLGFVDIKVCAVSPVWSGLKLVVRKELR